MFARKKAEPAKRRNHDLSQFGLTEIPDDFDPAAGFGDDDAGDSDLEAELAAIAGGGGPKPKVKAKPKATLLPASDLDKMIADSLRDVSDDDDDVDDDTDLLGELQTIGGAGDEAEESAPQQLSNTNEGTTNNDAETGTQLFLPTTTVDVMSVIRQRIDMYQAAEAQAKQSGESAKARRYARGLKTLNDLLKQASAGKTVNVDEIPPEVFVKAEAPAPVPASNNADSTPSTENSTATSPLTDDAVSSPKIPTRTAPAIPTPPSPSVATETPANNALIEKMRARQQEYKVAALNSKRSGDVATALQFLKVVKQFDIVIQMCVDGKEVDLSDMPPAPEEFLQFMAKMQAAADTPAEATSPAAAAVPTPTPITSVVADETSTPTSMLEALQQRLDKYKSVEDAAKTEGNTSKARRYGRIVKQYEDAIKSFKFGRAVAYDELPVPPGFGPLPTEAAAKTTTPPKTPDGTTGGDATPPPASPMPAVKRATPSPVKPELTTRTSGNHQKSNLAEQQMKTLLERQKEFKVAALEAKKAGEIEQAKEYLKIYKGFDALLNAASSGLPVDLNTLPVPPSQRENLETSFAIVTTEDCDPNDDMSDIGVRIEEQLAKQLMMCKNTRDHHKAMADVAGMNRFENLALTVQKDLDLVRFNKRKNIALPKFHYEKRSFNIVHCNTDLTDNELEIVVVRGIQYNVANPKDIDTYVKVEFPLLNEEFFRTKTNLIKDTDSPDYDQRFKIDIQRGNRQFLRIFKRHGVKFEVYSRGGFLRSDILIGTVNVKLQPLETKCDIHDTFDLMEGRKAVGGKLEIKVRVRNPMLTKQMEHLNEKWLVLDT